MDSNADEGKDDERHEKTNDGTGEFEGVAAVGEKVVGGEVEAGAGKLVNTEADPVVMKFTICEQFVLG